MIQKGGSDGGSSIRNAILIAGPTASGKSALALRAALETGGTIVNTDSMQVYGVLDRLTARPIADDLAAAPHAFYGHVSPADPYSTGRWLADVASLADVLTQGRSIFVGGTGLYFKALLEGLSDMPAIPEAVRAAWRARLAAEGAPSLHRLLAERDPVGAARLNPADGQRIVRALEVLEASGSPIGAWQEKRSQPIVDRASATMIVVEPDRQQLSRRIETRLACMMEDGALDEVRALLAMNIDPAMPAMKAIGVREFSQVLGGTVSAAAALAEAAAATRRYAKRQATWFRHQLGEGWHRIASADYFTFPSQRID